MVAGYSPDFYAGKARSNSVPPSETRETGMTIDANLLQDASAKDNSEQKKAYVAPLLADLDGVDKTASKAYSTQVENAFTGTLPS
jgi:hypothetical protein